MFFLQAVLRKLIGMLMLCYPCINQTINNFGSLQATLHAAALQVRNV